MSFPSSVNRFSTNLCTFYELGQWPVALWPEERGQFIHLFCVNSFPFGLWSFVQDVLIAPSPTLTLRISSVEYAFIRKAQCIFPRLNLMYLTILASKER